MIRIFSFACLALSVSGCSFLGSHAEGDFLCDTPLGNPCTSIADADAGTGATNATTVAEFEGDTQASELSQERIVLASAKSGAPTQLVPDGGAPYFVSRYRQPERLGSLWIAPRFDEMGVFHEANFLHFVLRDAAWLRTR